MQRNIFDPTPCPCWGTPARIVRPDVGEETLVGDGPLARGEGGR